VKSLTLMMTTTGARRCRSRACACAAPCCRARAARARGGGHAPAAVLGVIGSPAYPPDAAVLHQRLRGQRAACLAPAGTARQIVAVVADGDRSALLPRIQARTCIIHGEADPLVPVAAGRDLLSRIPGAVGDFIPGMGHDLPASCCRASPNPSRPTRGAEAPGPQPRGGQAYAA
jgi:pimeloyl-ACP methyl ester carboxylesterase